MKVAAQPRGHGATADTATGTILLRFDRLKGIERRDDVVRVEPGVQWRELNAALEGTGYITLPGSNGDTSVVGYSVGGGLSWFSRKYGQAAHQIRAIDLVDAEGNHRTVTADERPGPVLGGPRGRRRVRRGHRAGAAVADRGAGVRRPTALAGRARTRTAAGVRRGRPTTHRTS